MRAVDYSTIALRNIRRQLLRSVLTICALVISTTVLVVMLAIGLGSGQAIRDQFGNDDSLTVINVTANQSGGNPNPFGDVQQVNSQVTTLNDKTVEKLAAIPNVQRASARAHIWELASLTLPGSNKNLVASTEGVPSDAYLPLVAGGPFRSNDEKNQVIVGYGYAAQLGFANNPEKLIGSTITLTTQKGYRGDGAQIPLATASKEQNEAFNNSASSLQAKVVGVTTKGPNQNSVFVPLGWAHALRTVHYYENGDVKSKDQLATDGYSTIQVKAAALANVAGVAEAIGQLGYGQTSLLAQAQRVEQLTATMWVVLGSVAIIALVAAALGVVNTMLMAVSEQRYEIGVWRASGARCGLIVRLFLLEAAFLGLIGSVLGVGLALVVSGFLNHYGAALLSEQGFTAASVATVSPLLAGGAIVLTMVFSIVAGAYPAYRAARTDPSLVLSAGQ